MKKLIEIPTKSKDLTEYEEMLERSKNISMMTLMSNNQDMTQMYYAFCIYAESAARLEATKRAWQDGLDKIELENKKIIEENKNN